MKFVTFSDHDINWVVMNQLGQKKLIPYLVMVKLKSLGLPVQINVKDIKNQDFQKLSYTKENNTYKIYLDNVE